MGIFDLFAKRKEKQTSKAERPREEEKERNVSFETLKYDGVRAKNMGEFAFARRCFEEALKLADDVETESYLAETLVRLGELSQALSLLRPLAEKKKDNLTLWLSVAQVASQEKQWELVEHACDTALQLAPDDASASYLLAAAYEGMHKPEEALVLLDKLLERSPDFTAARLLRARVLFSRQRLEEAEKDLLALADVDDEEAWLLHGDVKSALYDRDGALHCYQKALDINPFSQESALRMACLYIDGQELDKALNTLNDFLAMDDSCAGAYKLRAVVRKMQNDLAGAEQDMQKSKDVESHAMGETLHRNIENMVKQRYYDMNPYGF